MVGLDQEEDQRRSENKVTALTNRKIKNKKILK